MVSCSYTYKISHKQPKKQCMKHVNGTIKKNSYHHGLGYSFNTIDLCSDSNFLVKSIPYNEKLFRGRQPECCISALNIMHNFISFNIFNTSHVAWTKSATYLSARSRDYNFTGIGHSPWPFIRTVDGQTADIKHLRRGFLTIYLILYTQYVSD